MKNIVFLHIEKAAGSSIRDLFYTNFGRRSVFWHGVNDEAESFYDFPIIGGHRPVSYYDESLANNALFLAILRNPFDRVVSLFNYYIQNDVKGMTESLGFDSESLENTLKGCATFKSVVANGQCRYISGYPDFLETLKEIKNKNYVIGVFEYLRLFERFIAKNFHLVHSSIPKSNVGSEGYRSRINLTPLAEEVINELTGEDQKLYNYIKSSSSGVFNSMPDACWRDINKLIGPLKENVDPEEYSGSIVCSGYCNNLKKGGFLNVSVKVANNSMFDWNNNDRQLKISYHWLCESGEMFQFEGARFPVEVAAIKAFGEYSKELEVQVPTIPGRYILQLTLLKEGVAWLENRGFSPADIEIVVS